MALIFQLFQVFWSDNGDLVAITTDESFYILKYDSSKIDEAKDNPEMVTEDGISDVFSEVRHRHNCFGAIAIVEIVVCRIDFNFILLL